MAGKISTFEEELNSAGYLVYTNCGDSMMPLLRQNRDLLHIRKSEGRCKKYDVPLYRRESGQYVLHRILKVRKDDYVICGDNRYQREYGIDDSHIIGVLEGITRDGKYIPVTDKKYRIYVHVWCDFFYVRAGILWIRQKIYRGLLKLRKRGKI